MDVLARLLLVERPEVEPERDPLPELAQRRVVDAVTELGLARRGGSG